mgnify:CR=1 FL=1
MERNSGLDSVSPTLPHFLLILPPPPATEGCMSLFPL